MPCIIGVDLDNTLVGYDEVLYRAARDRGWIPADTPKRKRIIRDRVRVLPGGEAEWQRLQAHIYGPGMREAEVIEGVREFLGMCREQGATVYVVSHKTRRAAADSTGGDLRQTALSWMRQQGLMGGGFGLPEGSVYFESSRSEKCERIRALGCTHFIDDLEETFRAPEFPDCVVKMLYAPDAGDSAQGDWRCFRSWGEIGTYVAESCRHG